MNYEIAYYSLSGNTEKLAYGIAKRLPENQAFLTNLQEEEVTLAADVYLVGFGILSKFPFVSFQFRKGHYNFCKSG